MVKGPENRFRDTKIRPLLDRLPKCSYFIKEAGAIRGIPDIIGCLNSKYFELEVKKDKAEMHHPRFKLQEYHMKQTHKALGFAEPIYPEHAREVFILLLIFCFSGDEVSSLMPLVDEYFPCE